MISRFQLPAFFKMVAAAWKSHCTANAINAPTTAMKDEWWRCELHQATGHDNLHDCNPTTDYEKAMAHFEEIIGDSIEWQMKLHKGDRTRLMHAIRKVCKEYDFTEEYASGIACQVTRQTTANLDRLNPKQLLAVLRALKIQTRRNQCAAISVPPEDDNQPF